MPGVYGYGDNFKSTIGMMIKNAFDKKEIGVFGKGENMRDFVLVDDLYNILTYAIMNKINGLVNITSGKSLSINEIAKLIRELHPFSVNIKHFPEKKRAEKRVKNLIFDSSMFKATFNNIQMTAHEQGISVYIHSINDDLERNSPIDSF
tara:strand:- start:523 stop:969 length:447 start_codon:yes stop_codon:yes gene_type:complete